MIPNDRIVVGVAVGWLKDYWQRNPCKSPPTQKVIAHNLTMLAHAATTLLAGHQAPAEWVLKLGMVKLPPWKDGR